jgi:hypothetical protein
MAYGFGAGRDARPFFMEPRLTAELELLVEGSTAAVAETRHHAGIVRVQRYGFSMP